MTDEFDHLPERFPDRYVWTIGAWPVCRGGGRDVQRLLTKGAGPNDETVVAIHEVEVIDGKRGLARAVIQLGDVGELLREAKAICNGDVRAKTSPGLIERLALLTVVASITGQIDKVTEFILRVDDADDLNPPPRT